MFEGLFRLQHLLFLVAVFCIFWVGVIVVKFIRFAWSGRAHNDKNCEISFGLHVER